MIMTSRLQISFFKPAASAVTKNNNACFGRHCHRRTTFTSCDNTADVAHRKHKNGPSIEKCLAKLGDLSFNDTKTAFRSKSNWHLWRALFVLKVCSFSTLMESSEALMHFGRRVLGAGLFDWLMKHTVYGHFVAGADHAEIQPVVQRLTACGVKSILDYSVEADVHTTVHETEDIKGVHDRRDDVTSARTYYYEGEPECDHNAAVFADCIEAVSRMTGGSGFSVVKLTALGRPQLLLRISEALRNYHNFFRLLTDARTDEALVGAKLTKDKFSTRLDELGLKADKEQLMHWFNDCDFDGDGAVDVYEWGRLIEHKWRLAQLLQVVDLRDGGRVKSLIADLGPNEELQFANLLRRLDDLAQLAEKRNIRMMIDAEQTYLQPAISRLSLEMMRKYNKKQAVIFNTYQAYLKSGLNAVKVDLNISRRENFYFGAKLVRGAYMVQERKRAEALSYEDPINPNYDATTQMYDAIFEEILREIKQRPEGHVRVMCATHNEETVRHVLSALRREGIGGGATELVSFGQLYGMCDQVSLALGAAGIPVYKYVPFGPLSGVAPYLARRLQENGAGLLSNSGRERRLIVRELLRRYGRLEFFHRPALAAASV